MTATPHPQRIRVISDDCRSLLRGTVLQATTMMVLAASAGVSAAMAAPPALNTGPQGGQVVGGQISIVRPNEQNTTITQSTPRGAVNWQSFDVGAQHTVTFTQPSAQAVTLNRVIGPDPSQIAGRINANGQIVLMNQSGIAFSQGAQVDTAGLVATASGMSTESTQKFMAGGKLFFDRAPKPDARVVNEGTITVAEDGLAALVAPNVVNRGLIQARLGKVILAGAEKHTIDLYGDGLLSIDVTQQVHQAPIGPDGKPVTALVTNTGTILANGGKVLLTARAVDGIVQTLVSAGGTIRADSTGGRTGTVVVQGRGGDVRVDGSISVSGKDPATKGGKVAVNATGAITIAASARIDASGSAGGGTVALGTTLARAGGDAPIRPKLTAARTTVERGAKITASATVKGDGGRIAIRSTQSTGMAGTAEAKGGKQGGDGGFVEVSGNSSFSLTGTIDLSAPAGHVGTLLIDPYDLVLSNISPGGSVAWVDLALLNASIANVVVQAAHDLSVVYASGQPNAVSLGTNTLTLQAGHDLSIDRGISVTAGALTLASGYDFLTSTPSAAGAISVGSVIGAGAGAAAATQITASMVTLQAGTGGVSLTDSVIGTSGTPATTLDISAVGGGVLQSATGAIYATTLTSTGGVAGGTSFAGTANQVSLLGPISTTAGSFTLTDTQAVSVIGDIKATSSLAIIDTAGITQNAGTGMIAGAPASSVIPSLDLIASGGDFVQQTGALIQATNAAGWVRITAQGSVRLGGTVQANAGTGQVSLVANGGIIAEPTMGTAPTGVILADNLTGSSFGATRLDNPANKVLNLQAFSAGAGFILNNGQALTLATGSTVNGTVHTNIAANGTLTVNGTLGGTSIDLRAGDIAVNGTVQGTYILLESADTGGNLVASYFANGAGTLTPGSGMVTVGVGGTITGTGSVAGLIGSSLINAGMISADPTTGVVTLVAGGNITEPTSGGTIDAAYFAAQAGFTFGGSKTATGGSIDLSTPGANHIGSIGIMRAASPPGGSSGGDITIRATPVTGSSPVLTVINDITADGVLLVSSSGGIIQNLGTTISAARVGLPGSPSLDLQAFGGDLVQAPTAIIDATAAGGWARVQAAGSLQLTGTVQANPATGQVSLIATRGTITQTGMLAAGTLSGSSLGSTSLTGTTPTTNQIAVLSNFSSAGFTLNDGLALNLAGAVTGGSSATILDDASLTVSPGGSIGATSVFLTGGSIAIAGSVNGAMSAGLFAATTLDIPGSLSGGIVTTVAGTRITETGTLTAGTLTGQVAAGPARFTGTTNQVLGIGNFHSLGDFILTNAAGIGLTVTGSLMAGNVGTVSNVRLSADSLSITGSIIVPGGSAGVAGGEIALAPTSMTRAITFDTVTQAGSLSLTTADIANLHAGDYGRYVIGSLDDGLSVRAAVIGPGTATALAFNGSHAMLALYANGNVTIPAAVTTSMLTGNTGGNASFSSLANQIAMLGPFTAAGAFTLTDALAVSVVGSVQAGLSLRITDAVGITQSAGTSLIAGAAASGTSPSLDLTASGGDFVQQMGALVQATDHFGWARITAHGSIQLGGTVQANAGSGMVSLIANGGTIAEPTPGSSPTGAVLADNLTGFSAGETRLDNSTNGITNLLTFSAGAGFTLNDGRALTVAAGNAVSGATFSRIATNGTLTVNGAVSAGDVDLRAGDIVVNGSASGITVELAAADPLHNVTAAYFANGGGMLSAGGGSVTVSVGANVSGSATVSIQAGSSLSDSGTIASNAGSGVVTLLAGTDIVEPIGSGTIDTAYLSAKAGFAALGGQTVTGRRIYLAAMPGANHIANLGPIAAVLGSGVGSGNITLDIGNGATVSGTIAADAALRLSASAITQSAGTAITGGSLVALAAADGFITQQGGSLIQATGANGAVVLTAATIFHASGIALGGRIEADNGGGARVDLNAVNGPISETVAGVNGVIVASNLYGTSAGATMLGSGNQIATLGNLSTGSDFTLNTTQNLFVAGTVIGNDVALGVAGNLTDGGALRSATLVLTGGGDLSVSGLAQGSSSVRLTAGGGIDVSGNLVGGTVVLNAGAGIAGTGTLTGNSIDATAGGSFSETGATISAARIRATAPAIFLRGGSVTTGTTPVPGGTLTPGQIPDGTGQGLFLNTDNLSQTGTTTVNGSGAAGTIRVGPRVGGSTVTASFTDLQAQSSKLYLLLGSGTATGGISSQGLEVAYGGSGGSASLTGMVNGQSGQAAAAASFITPSMDSAYQINGCVIGSVSCSLIPVIPPPVIFPTVNPPEVIPVSSLPEIPLLTAAILSPPAVLPVVRLPAFFLLTDMGFLQFSSSSLSYFSQNDLFSIFPLVDTDFGKSSGQGDDLDDILPDIADRDF